MTLGSTYDLWSGDYPSSAHWRGFLADMGKPPEKAVGRDLQMSPSVVGPGELRYLDPRLSPSSAARGGLTEARTYDGITCSRSRKGLLLPLSANVKSGQVNHFTLPNRMLALRFHGNRDLRVDEVPMPELRPGLVLVKNAWAGICGSGRNF